MMKPVSFYMETFILGSLYIGSVGDDREYRGYRGGYGPLCGPILYSGLRPRPLAFIFGRYFYIRKCGSSAHPL